VDASDLAVRQATYALFTELGRAPSASEVAARSGSAIRDIDAAWRFGPLRELLLDLNATKMVRSQRA
jgi:hypothetical protein